MKGYIHIDDVYRLIAGHSNYHGDNILSALTCIAEGKNVTKSITPLDEEKVIKTELIDINIYGYKYKKCGNCKEEYLERYVHRWFFCPRCGAKFINIMK